VIARSALFSFLFFLSYNIYAQSFPDKSVDRNLTLAINYTISQNYKSAELILKKLDKEYPALPIGKIYLAGLSITKSVDLAQEFDKKLIYNYLNKAESQSDSLIDVDPKNPWYKYFAGLTNAYKAYFHSEEGNYLSALIKGFSAISYFDECMEIDSSFAEAKAALGIYMYWKSYKIKGLDFLPFVNDNRGKAINLIEDALRNTVYNKYLIIHSLFWIYSNEKEFKKAGALAELTLNAFPNSRTFLSDYAHSLKQYDKQKSLVVYKKLLKDYQTEKSSNRINEIITKHKIAIVYFEIGNKTEALKICKEILSDRNIPEASLKFLSERIQRIKEMKKELEHR